MMADYDNFLIKEIDAMGTNYLALAEASRIIERELTKFKTGKLTDQGYKRQLEEARTFVERRKARIPYEPGE